MGPDRTQNAAPLAAKSRVVGPPRGSKSDSMGFSRLPLSLLSLMAEVERLACPGEGVAVDVSFSGQSRCQCCPPQWRHGRHC
eukprot:2888374-Pleurochrysis_carterae.AAC.2